MKTVVVLPGSHWQIPIVKKVKEMGYRVLVVNPYEDSPAFAYADGHLQSDIFDEETVLAYCKKEKASAIISEECDIAMPIVARYSKKLGLFSLSEHAAHLYTDKYSMRDFCMQNELPTPAYRKCFTIQEATDFFHLYKHRMIMKPLDSNSSRGVYTIESAEDIEKYFQESLSYSKIQKAVLLERYINGPEFTVDGIKTPEGHYSLAISKKKHFEHNENIASELYFTHSDDTYDYELLKSTNDKFVNASDLEFGLTHAEYKYENGIFYLIEIGARGGGNKISSDIVPFMSGIDNYKYLIECSLGKIAAPNFSVRKERLEKAAVLKFFETPNEGGVVEAIEGVDFLSNHKCIVDFKFNFAIGDKIEPAKNDAARVGYYIACCDTQTELEEIMMQIKEKVKIILRSK